MDQIQTHRKLNTIFALMVTGVSFFTYLAIVAPTVSFWDCGEYSYGTPPSPSAGEIPTCWAYSA